MNKTLKSILSGLLLVVILIVFYLLTFQISEKRLIIKEATAVISIDDLNSGKMKSYYELYEKITKSDSQDIKKYAKYIKGIDIISYDDSTPDYKTENKEVMAIDIGWLYPIAKYKQSEYFDNLGKNYFALKEIYQKELYEKYGIENKIYMTNYKGYYFVSDDVMKLSDYMRLIVKKESNKNITSNLKGDALIEVIADLDGSVEGMTALKINLDYEKNELIFNGYMYGKLENSKYLEGIDSKDRKLTNYMGKDRIYLTNKDFKGLTEFIRGNLNPEIASALSLVKMFTGKELEDYMEDVDGELIYDYSRDQLILPLKETKEFEKLLNVFTKKSGDVYILNNGKTIEIVDKVLYYNGKMSEGDITPEKEGFIDGSLNLGLYNKVFNGIYVNLGGKTDKKSINLRATLKDEDLLEIYKRMEVTE